MSKLQGVFHSNPAEHRADNFDYKQSCMFDINTEAYRDSQSCPRALSRLALNLIHLLMPVNEVQYLSCILRLGIHTMLFQAGGV